VLQGGAVRREDERDQRQLRVALELGLGRGAAEQPFVRDPLVAEVGPHLHGIGRELGPEDAIRISHPCGTNAPSTVNASDQSLRSRSVLVITSWTSSTFGPANISRGGR